MVFNAVKNKHKSFIKLAFWLAFFLILFFAGACATTGLGGDDGETYVQSPGEEEKEVKEETGEV